MTIIMLILILFGLAALAINIAYFSTLAHDIKTFLCLHESQRLQTISKYGFWRTFLPRGLNVLAFIPTIIMMIFKKSVELINCQYCTSWWLGFGYTLYSGYAIIDAIALGGLTLFFVIIIEKLMQHNDR